MIHDELLMAQSFTDDSVDISFITLVIHGLLLIHRPEGMEG